MTRHPFLLGLVAAAVLAAPAWSAPPLAQWVERSWRFEQGLPQDSVTAVLQTRDGFLWLGTQEGLVRFDGVRFTLFNKRNVAAFAHNEITALAEAPDGTLWIGTYDGLVSERAGRFAAWPLGGGARAAIVALTVDAQGTVWLATRDGVAHRLAGGRIERVDMEEVLVGGRVTDVAVGTRGDLWVATTRGLARRRGERWTIWTHASGLPSDEVLRMLAAPNGEVWLGTRRGIGRIAGDVAQATQQPPALEAASVSTLARERSGALWAGTEEGVAWRLDAGAWSSRPLAAAAQGDALLAIAEDREGGMWIGAFTSGLHRLWRGRFSQLTRENGLADNESRAVLQTRDGATWIASEAAGLTRIHAGRVTHFGRGEGLPSLVVRALYEDSEGALWVGTRSGLARFSRGRFATLPATAAVSVRAIAEDARGVLWVGTAAEGVFRLVDGARVVVADDGRTPLPRGVVRSMARDRTGAMWIGTDDALFRWQSGALTRFGLRDGLPPAPIYAMHEDARGVLWLGTYGGGLVRWKDGRFVRFTQADGLFDDVVYQVLEDDAGNLWLSCNNGISRVAKSQLDAFAEGTLHRFESTAYDASDGMPSRECNGNAQPAGWRTREGPLWFPTTGGVAIVDPANLSTRRVAPLAAIVRASADGRPVALDRAARMPPRTGRVEIEYAGLGFLAPDRLEFRYRLEGLESDWVGAGERRQTVYTSLAPGDYVFRVSARLPDGEWSSADARFAFSVKPHWSQTTWFRGVALLAAALGVLGAVRLRELRHLRSERELADRVEQALGRIKVLSGLLPICASCKKIRDDRGYWNQLERYLSDHSEAVLSHGLCPQCVEQLYPEYPGDPGSGGTPKPG